MKKEYNLNLSFIRFILCISVFLYHLNLLKGGYLAVCSFFVFVGYFTTKSLCEADSILKYYKKRIKKIYLPLLLVVFITISFIILFDITIFNMKPEINSILLGYNNFFQLSTNSDYFAKHIGSPFIHLWYISILLQIELIFPLIFLALKKVGKRINKFIPILIVTFLTIISTVYFYNSSISSNILNTYYNTFTRVFSFFFGVLTYVICSNYKRLIPIKNKSISIIMFLIYLIILSLLFIFVDAKSSYFTISMILTTIVTCRLIDYSEFLYEKRIQIKSVISNIVSNISYEIYLVQYPVIFFFIDIKLDTIIKIPLIIVITIVMSYLINLTVNILKKDKLIVLRILVSLIVIPLSIYGLYNYIIMKDYTKEMNDLKNKLNNNEKLMKEKQDEYLKKEAQDEKKLEEYIKSLEVDEKQLHNHVDNLKVVGVGDSILLDAIDTLYKVFPNGYFDGKVSRSTCAGAEVLKDIKNKGIKWDVLVFNLGTNDYPNDRCKNNIMAHAGDSKVFWLNTTHPDYSNCNSELEKYAKKHKNITILDWESVIKKHPEYLYVDYTHLRPKGFLPYANFIKEEIYNYYLDELNKKKDESINKYKSNQLDKVNFYGDELLINIYDDLDKEFMDSKIEATNDMGIKKLKEILKNDNRLSKKLVFVFNDNSGIKINDYIELSKIYKDHFIYIITKEDIKLTSKNITLIRVNLNKGDYLSDKIHLNAKGNKKIVDNIIKNIK